MHHVAQVSDVFDTHISYAVNKTSLDLNDLKKVFGHSDKMDTKGTYVHGIEQNEKERREEESKLKEMAHEIEWAISR